MSLIRTIALVAVCFTGIATAQKVVSQYDRGTDFSKFKTYKWIIIQGTTPNQITAQNIVGLVNTALGEKGLLQSEGNTDLLVGFQTSVDQQRQINGFNNGSPRMGGMGQATSSIIEVGTLVVDMYDPGQKQLVWRSSATKTLTPGGNPEKNYERLEKAVDKLLKEKSCRKKF
jgi:hypothetical protein